MVQISDLIIGVDIALGFTPVSRCVLFDADNDGRGEDLIFRTYAGSAQ